MASKVLSIGLIALALCGTSTAQTLRLAKGRATVDGLLSAGEWDKANWIAMEHVYAGNPVDLTNASWAAMWEPSRNVIYVAVTGTDTDLVMRAYSSWDGQDGIEVYINARNDDIKDYAARDYDYAQQYVIGYDTNAASLWAVLGGGDVLPPNALPAMAFGLVGDRITYELELRPYDVFDYSAVTNSTEVRLRSSVVVGLDVVMNSRTSAGVFGMLCENGLGSKFTTSANFLDHKLVGSRGPLMKLSSLLWIPVSYAGPTPPGRRSQPSGVRTRPYLLNLTR